MTGSTRARPLDTTGTRTDTVVKHGATFAQVPDLLGAFERMLDSVRLEQVESFTTDLVVWLESSSLDEDDRRQFRHELLMALKSDLDEVERVIREWRITAEVLRDETAREILLGASTADDYVEVERPA